jgi:hypothetical protein
LIDALPWQQALPLQILAGGLDWPTLLPGGAFVRGAQGGIAISRTALNVAMAGGVATTAQEIALHGTQETRTKAESVQTIGASVRRAREAVRMSAFLAVRQRDCIHLLTDGALLAPDGAVAAFGFKVFELPQCRAAVTTRGLAHFLPWLQKAFESETSFDVLVEAAPAVLSELRKLSRDTDFAEWEAFIAGFSAERNPPEMYLYEAPKAAELCKLNDDNYAAGPQPSIATLMAAGFEPPASMEEFSPVIHGVPVMEAFRRTRAPMALCVGEVYGVGGFVADTVVRSQSVETSIIHAWPDAVGRCLAPIT